MLKIRVHERLNEAFKPKTVNYPPPKGCELLVLPSIPSLA